MQLPTTLLLIAVELGFLFALTWRCDRVAPVYAYLSWLAAYGAVAWLLGARGVYVSDAFLAWLPGLWISALAFAAAIVPVVLFAGVREGLRRIADATPWHVFASFHALRIAALGTALKAHRGEFPVSFELMVGIPDLLFGLSALWVAWKARRDQISETGFLVWNLVGVLVIVPAAPIALQLGLPGPLQVFTALPDARAVLTHPMSIAPTFGVPLFVLTNLWLVWRLWELRAGSASMITRASSPERT